ncbi:MAG: VOC family protein [Gammaproteobacteria bacterium]
MITGMPRIAIAVHDFDATVATFRDRLAMPVLDISENSVPSLGAKLAMCVPEGGSNIELMSPANPDAPLSQSLQRFLDRRGEGLFALMLEAPDPDEEAEALIARGLDVLPLMAGAGGRDIHPRSTHGVLIRVYPVSSFRGRPPQTDAEPDSPPLSGIMRVIIATRDLDDAVNVYGTKLGIVIDTPSEDLERGVGTALCRPPTGGVIELVTPVDERRSFAQSIAEFLQSRGEGMYCLVLQAQDPQAAAAILAERDVNAAPARDSATIFEIPRSDASGALLRIEAAA